MVLSSNDHEGTDNKNARSSLDSSRRPPSLSLPVSTGPSKHNSDGNGLRYLAGQRAVQGRRQPEKGGETKHRRPKAGDRSTRAKRRSRGIQREVRMRWVLRVQELNNDYCNNAHTYATNEYFTERNHQRVVRLQSTAPRSRTQARKEEQNRVDTDNKTSATRRHRAPARAIFFAQRSRPATPTLCPLTLVIFVVPVGLPNRFRLRLHFLPHLWGRPRPKTVKAISTIRSVYRRLTN